ncbi:plasmid stabilization protein [Opitutaceae bacterium TAV5]|nr:plasmid stabilization protein [Opitutaceae bacterium TAV5]
MKPHGFHREAEEEYVKAAGYYAKISPDLGERFYDEMERLIAEVCRWPQTYRYIRRPVRRHFSTLFPYGILYEEKPDHIRIVAVMPLHREPDYWLHRVD